METRKFNIEDFTRKGAIVGILRGYTVEESMFIADAFVGAGLYALEITMNTTGVEKIIAGLSEKYPQLSIGAGTVCAIEDLEKAVNAGAQFIVTPVLDETVMAKAVELGVPIFPGAYTPSEIYKAWTLGASAVKIFPATSLGPQYVKDVLAPLNDLKLLPTGGVSGDNIRTWFDAGAFGAGMGSSLINEALLKDRDHKGLVAHLKGIADQIRN
ncbi:bifunctional 4-hydroxy-2-oxoglutarate aldolase/2-dehydro-3-deoxy-phosphogluconate aldolase [Reichenbachiella sp.]|uniref:bifunctional 4-hydroxy-2-oxoglutarate aldolase/2-dehydro-3-deoxy-phosphogluconate aldolase n=1 Tax=Reichenbachiella sp. TaxID=2184521 RepID=UPI003BAE6A98